MTAERATSAGAAWAERYLASGWALLLPYLAIYLGGAHSHAPVASLLVAFRILHVIHAAALLWWLVRHRRRVADPILAAWFLAALVVWSAGSYLEFPSDPWEHLARINTWAGCPTVTDHAHWRKSSYFLAFSLTGLAPSDQSLTRLDLYQTGITLLWMWQMARVAAAAGLGRGAAFIAAVVMLLTAGNNAFSFHRYYGLSSTLVAQVGVLAFTHACLTARRESWRAAAFEAAVALALIAFEHTQGLAMAALAGGAILLGRWTGRSLRRAAWLGALLLALSGAVYAWYPRVPVMDAIANPGGWLSPWLGFNLLSASSPAASQAFVILGLIGVANVLAGLFLCFRGNIVGWMTAGPVAALLLPLVTVPLADYLLRSSDLAIFHRLLFAIPPGLALVTVADLAWRRWAAERPDASARLAPAALGVVALVFVLVPASRSGFNRTWHALAIVPADLSLAHLAAPRVPGPAATALVVPPGLDFVFAANQTRGLPDYALNWSSRLIVSTEILTPARRWQLATQAVTVPPKGRTLAFVADRHAITTDFSLAARLSGHWLEQEVSLEHAAFPEFRRAALQAGFRPLPGGQGRLLESGSAAINAPGERPRD